MESSQKFMRSETVFSSSFPTGTVRAEDPQCFPFHEEAEAVPVESIVFSQSGAIKYYLYLQTENLVMS
jgi:hypothetical protein